MCLVLLILWKYNYTVTKNPCNKTLSKKSMSCIDNEIISVIYRITKKLTSSIQ